MAIFIHDDNDIMSDIINTRNIAVVRPRHAHGTYTLDAHFLDGQISRIAEEEDFEEFKKIVTHVRNRLNSSSYSYE